MSPFPLTFLVFLTTLHSLHGRILAEFTTTLGDFTCELNPDEAPLAVANFVGLAEGSRAWVDPVSNTVRMGVPFYDGTIFHRTVSGFVNQGGSRNGLGTDGPGYVFRDETENGLNHAAAYVLSMANAGSNSNGAQFFITLAPLPALNGLHTVFGRVVSGQEVVETINAVPKVQHPSFPGEISKPLTDIVVSSVRIRRIGPQAEAFDVEEQGLPTASGIRGGLRVQPGISAAMELEGDITSGSFLSAFRSSDLLEWTPLRSEYIGTAGEVPASWTLDGAPLPRAFYQLAVVRYPDAMGPANYRNRTLTLDFPPIDRWEFAMDSGGTGGALTVTSYETDSVVTLPTSLISQTSEPYSLTVVFDTPGLPEAAELPRMVRIFASLNSRSSGNVTGTQTTQEGNPFGWGNFDSGTIELTE